MFFRSSYTTSSITVAYKTRENGIPPEPNSLHLWDICLKKAYIHSIILQLPVDR